MDEPSTCGRGLAAHSGIPAKIGELIAGLAENLEVHMRSLDLDDPAARQEHEAYLGLVTQHRAIAARLAHVAAEMAGHRDLPMGRHDERIMADALASDAFVRFVAVERELLSLLEDAVAEDEEMLAGIRPP